MKLEDVAAWIDRTLGVKKFSDVSNNGIQIQGASRGVARVAFGVDASADFLCAAAEAGAQLAVVHHGISWDGGIKRIAGGVYNVVKAAMDADLALYAVHLPLDADRRLGHNWTMARAFGLKNLKPAFVYHGETIGVVGDVPRGHRLEGLPQFASIRRAVRRVGICSGGAGCFAEDAKNLGCDLFVTGEASWGETVAAENCGIEMVCAGHYETETFGVKALARAMERRLGLQTLFIGREGGIR